MKIQLDTTNKVIKLESSINLGELVKNLEKLLPKGEWKDFSLETNTVINNWSNPIIIRDRDWFPTPHKPWDWYYKTGDVFSYKSDSGISMNTKNELKSGLFNIELKENENL